ncbi:MAG: hypothetical protein P8123_04340, partial [bacterium]
MTVTIAHGAIQVPSGYEAEALGQNFMGGFDYLPNGDIIGMYADPLFAENSILGVIDANGDGIPAEFDKKYEFGIPVWAGFVKVSPGGGIVLFGESSTYKLYVLDLATYAVTELTPVSGSFDGAYDLAFVDDDHFFLSANPAYGTTNKVYRGDLSGNLQEVISVASTYNSGIDVDDSGNLYFLKYGVVVPPPAGGCPLLRFAREDIDAVVQGAPVLGEGDATEIARLDGSFDVAWRSSGDFFVSDANNGKVYDVTSTGEVSDFATLAGDPYEGFRVLAIYRRDQSFNPGESTIAELAVDYLPLSSANPLDTYRITTTGAVPIRALVNSTILPEGSQFIVTVVAQPTTTPFDGYVVLIGPGGTAYSLTPNGLTKGVAAYAKGVPGVGQEFKKRVLDLKVPGNVPAGVWTVYAGLMPEGTPPSPSKALALDSI